MTKTMYRAILEIAENGERFRAHDLNVNIRTVRALARRNYIAIENGHAIVTERGWNAVASI